MRINRSIKIIIIITLLLTASLAYLGLYPIYRKKIDVLNTRTPSISSIFQLSNLLELNHHNDELQKNFVIIVGLQIDDLGNLWVIGNINTGRTSLVEGDIFLSKINPNNGEIIWMKIYDGNAPMGDSSIAFDSEGNVIVAFSTTSREFNIINAEGYYLPDIVSEDVFIEKMDPNGKVLWSTYYGGPFDECCSTISTDEEDNIYLNGWSGGGPYFPIKDSWLNQTSDQGDLFLAKFMPNGTLEWSTILDGNSRGAFSHRFFGNGRLILAGWSSSSNLFVPNPTSGNTGGLFTIIELNVTSKEIVWGNQYGGTNIAEAGFKVDMDEANNIIQVGNTGSVFNVKNGIDTTLNLTDGLIVKYNSSRGLEWSTYLGGTLRDTAGDVIFDDNGDVIIAGATASSDFPVTDSSTFQGQTDVFLTKINSDGTQILMSTLMGGEGIETDASLFAFGWIRLKYSSGSYYVLSQTESDIKGMYANNTKLEPNYPFTFGGARNGFIYQLNAETFAPERLLTAIVVPQPDLDFDNDGLTNWEEYRLFVDKGIEVDPLNADTDGDGLPDGWEIEFNLDPASSNPDDDRDSNDEDGLFNLQEYEFGTWPNSSDSDGDGMPDKWEFDMGLDGTYNDADEDADGDLMSNLYEFEHNFNASLSPDGNEDPDQDGAVNTVEYLEKTDPFNFDTDGDGLPDGYEIAYNLNPLVSNANLDSDGDFIPDITEFKLRLNPDSKIELFVFVGIFIAIIGSIMFFRIRRKRRNVQSKEAGYKDYNHQRQIQRTGYKSLEDFESAKSRGFQLAKAEEIITSLNYKTISEYQTGIEKLTQDLIITYTDNYISDKLSSIQSTKTPIELHQLKSQFNKIKTEIETSLSELNRIIIAHQAIVKLFDKNKEVFSNLDQVGIELNLRQLEIAGKRLIEFLVKIEKEYTQQEEWFKPWSSLLKLIQITEEDKPITLQDIIEVVKTSADQAEKLLVALLDENPQIGIYDSSTKIYIKSTGTEVSAYLDTVLNMLDKLESS